MGVAGLLASAVGAAGVRSFAETLTADPDALVRRLPIFSMILDAPAVPVAAALEAAPSPSPEIRRVQIANAPVATAAPFAPIQLTPAARPQNVRPSIHRPAASDGPANTNPAALALPPVANRGSASTSDEWFGEASPSRRNSTARPLADRGGRALEFVDAGPIADIADVGPIAAALPPSPMPRVGPLTGTGLPDAVDELPDAAGPKVRVLGTPVVAPPLEQVVDVGALGVDTGPALDDGGPPVELPWEVLIDGDGPRTAPTPDWTPGTGEFREVEVLPDGTIVYLPEPTSLVALGAGIALLARRRRRA